MARLLAAILAALLLAGCVQPATMATYAPCPPAALAVCHAGASACAAPPFCYRTLGMVDCYLAPEAGRRTAEEIVAPLACPLSAVVVGVRPAG